MNEPRECHCYYSLIKNEGDAETFVAKIDYDALAQDHAKLKENCRVLREALDQIAILGSGDKAYTADFTTEVMGIVRKALRETK